jgi:Flp pilus assembly pilin Flp
MPTGGGLLRKIVGLVAVIALLVIGFAGSVIDGLWSFFQQLGG